MIDLCQHVFKAGAKAGNYEEEAALPPVSELRAAIEPWLTSVFQSEHLSVLLGSGLPLAVSTAAGCEGLSMAPLEWETELGANIAAHADRAARQMGRGGANVEDQFRAALQLRAGLEISGDGRAAPLGEEIDTKLSEFLKGILRGERALVQATDERRQLAEGLLVSFLLSFASRAATRERLNLFTTNYDRLIERGCDLAGLHLIDRFVGQLEPVFRASRLSVDLHYNPPGIRGEPRYLEGVVRISKIHGSIDWRWGKAELRRCALPFGAPENHPAIPAAPSESVIIYPNPAKDFETLEYPYAELFRDFAAAICRPNAALVTYGYGFGDDHINRVIRDMLTIPSTHLVVINWDKTNPVTQADAGNATRLRLKTFIERAGRPAQVSLLLGSHFGDLENLASEYLPKPAIDSISIRRARLLLNRGEHERSPAPEQGDTNE